MNSRINTNHLFRQVKIGATISYVLIIVNALYGIAVSPFILESIGKSAYGVYKTVASISSALMILDLGLGGTVMRYIAKFRADGEKNKINSFVSMALYEGLGLILLILTMFFILISNIQRIYGNSFSETEIILARNLLIILSGTTVTQIIGNILNGIVTGYNNFIVGNGLKLFRVASQMLLIFLLLSSHPDAMVLAYINLFVTIVTVCIEGLIVLFVYKIRLNFCIRAWDLSIFRESSIYTFLLFLTSVVAQVNNNLDNILIGAIHGPNLVTVYSFGLLIFGMFEQLSTAISQVMLPTVMNVLKQEDGMTRIQHLIIRAGRIQFALLGAALVGFSVLGKQFISLWLGEGFEDVYIIVLILMIPATLELCVNVCLSVLRAKNMLGFRTMVLCASTVLNFVITLVGVKYFSYLSAAVGTAVSFIVGSLIVMNLYYYKKLSISMSRIYAEIFSRIWICLIIGGLSITVSSRFLTEGWMAFLMNVGIFALVYGILMLLFGFTKEEIKSIPLLKRLRR